MQKMIGRKTCQLEKLTLTNSKYIDGTRLESGPEQNYPDMVYVDFFGLCKSVAQHLYIDQFCLSSQ